jgi:RNA recognition motif-containing protein
LLASTVLLNNGKNQPGSPSQVAEGNDDQDPAAATILQTSRLFLRNLTFTCTEDDLMELFKPFGEVSQVRCVPSLPLHFSRADRRFLTLCR